MAAAPAVPSSRRTALGRCRRPGTAAAERRRSGARPAAAGAWSATPAAEGPCAARTSAGTWLGDARSWPRAALVADGAPVAAVPARTARRSSGTTGSPGTGAAGTGRPGTATVGTATVGTEPVGTEPAAGRRPVPENALKPVDAPRPIALRSCRHTTSCFSRAEELFGARNPRRVSGSVRREQRLAAERA